MQRCPKCQAESLIPIVYNPDEEDLLLTDLGAFHLGSTLVEEPRPKWYCPGCGEDIAVHECSFPRGPGRDFETAYQHALNLIRQHAPRYTPNEHRRARGIRWLKLIAKALALNPKQIIIRRAKYEALIEAVLEDEVIEFPSFRLHMFEDIVYLLGDQSSSGIAPTVELVRSGELSLQGQLLAYSLTISERNEVTAITLRRD